MRETSTSRAARRTRRFRRTTAAVVAALAVVLLTPASGLTVDTGRMLWGPGHVSTGAEHCPAKAWEPRSLGGPSGRLAAPGAFAVTLCTYPFRTPGDRPRTPTQESILAARGTDRLLHTLDRLPPGPHGDIACTAIGLPDFQLIVAYRDRPPTVIDLELNCGLATSRSAVRSYAGKALDAFVHLYREQLAAAIDPRTVKAAGCPASLEPTKVAGNGLVDEPVDQTIRSFDDETVVPASIAVATACRYDRDGDSLRLTRRVTTREDLETLRSTVNKAFHSATDPTTDTSDVEAVMECEDRTDLSRLDVLWTVDATGALQELRVHRAPCAAVARRGYGGFAPGPALTALLDRLLG